MGTFQTLISLVILIFVLSVMVQAVQEVIKAALKTKAGVMRQTIDKSWATTCPWRKCRTPCPCGGSTLPL
jgi:hypothetical protein